MPLASAPVVLIANPAAGRGSAVERARAASAALARVQVAAEVCTPQTPQAAVVIAREAAASGATAVVACGGDGTMHTVLQAVAGTSTPFAILPCGTGDDNAHQLRTPGEPNAWAAELGAALQSGRIRTIDLGRATADSEQRWFMGVLSTGFDSCVNERANRMSWPRGQAKYLASILAELGSFVPVPYRVTVDGVEHADTGMLVCVGNGSRYGGGMLVCPDAVVDDGLLDLTWLGEVPRATFLRVFPTVFRGTHVRHRAVRTLRGRSIRIEGAGQVAYADGERLGELPVEITVVPQALRVLDFRLP